MSNDNKVYGEITINPPLNWGLIRAYMGGNPKAPTRLSESLRLVIEEATEETDEGTIVTKSCDTIYPASMDSHWGVVEALALMGSLAKDHEFSGEFTIVDENPEFDEKYVEARRYALSDGKIYHAEAQVVWGNYKEGK